MDIQVIKSAELDLARVELGAVHRKAVSSMASVAYKFTHSTRALLIIVFAATFLFLPGCAKICGNSGTRQSTWGIVFRCTTSNRIEHYDWTSTDRRSLLGSDLQDKQGITGGY